MCIAEWEICTERSNHVEICCVVDYQDAMASMGTRIPAMAVKAPIVLSEWPEDELAGVPVEITVVNTTVVELPEAGLVALAELPVVELVKDNQKLHRCQANEMRLTLKRQLYI